MASLDSLVQRVPSGCSYDPDFQRTTPAASRLRAAESLDGQSSTFPCLPNTLQSRCCPGLASVLLAHHECVRLAALLRAKSGQSSADCQSVIVPGLSRLTTKANSRPSSVQARRRNLTGNARLDRLAGGAIAVCQGSTQQVHVDVALLSAVVSPEHGDELADRCWSRKSADPSDRSFARDPWRPTMVARTTDHRRARRTARHRIERALGRQTP